ncbi:helix-turn-helix domain-containing protein [Corynebacterium sp. A21]|uniref:helix-turn-helix domain-containing protein n=1 Tax=Corynebacterium sp. A21 TaxID=3457318 RepID=UPI003FD1F372
MSSGQVIEPDWVTEMPRPVRRMVEQIPSRDPLTGAGLRAARDSLGLSAKDLAHALGASLRMVQIWETQDHIPSWVHGEVVFLVETTDLWIKTLAGTTGPVSIHREGWRLVEDDRIMPESWWRTVVGRALDGNIALDVRWGMPTK